jgi:hypothetical protein
MYRRKENPNGDQKTSPQHERRPNIGNPIKHRVQK